MSKIVNRILNNSNSFKYYKSEYTKLKNELEYLKQNSSLNKDFLNILNELNNNQFQIKDINKEVNLIKIQNNFTYLRDRAKNNKIKILFITYFMTIMWDSLIELLKMDSSFDPIILTVPKGMNFESNEKLDDFRKQDYEDTYNYYKNKGFTVIKGFDEQNHNFLDIVNEINPNIVFYSSPHESFFPLEYRIDAMPLTTLFCYIPYSMNNHVSYWHIFNQNLHKKDWKLFYETSEHKKLAIKYSDIGASNVLVTGCARLDSLITGEYKKSPKVWDDNSDKIRIVWAPHHSITDIGTPHSTFLENYKFFYEYAKKHTEIEWIFKPHPYLMTTIKNNPNLFDKNKDPDEIIIELLEYYENWKELPNAHFHDKGDYINIFVNSDAMITDSNSFISEYIYFNKPGLFLKRKGKEVLNEYGKIFLNGWYQVDGNDFEGIEDFIDTVLVKKEDSLEDNRKKIYNKYLNTNEITAGSTIYNYLRKELLE
jgi:hypothetical protein